MSNLPYAQATIPEEYRRHIVQYARKEVPGTRSIPARSFAERPSNPLRRHRRRRRASLERYRHGWPQGRMAVVDTNRRRTHAAWTLTSLRDWPTAKSDACTRAISVLRWQGHAVPYPRHQPARIYRPSHLLRLHPHDQRGRDRPLQSRQGRHDCRCPRANSLVIRSATGPQRLDRHSTFRLRHQR